MSKPTITQHFANLGAPLANPLWSWGAVRKSDGLVILRVWNDEKLTIDGRLFRKLADPEFATSLGYAERLEHLEMIRGGKPGFMVIVTAKDPDAKGSGAIANYTPDRFRPVGELVVLPDGCTYGECLPTVGRLTA